MVLPALLEDSSFGDGEAVDQKSECASQCSFTSYQSSMSHNSLYSASGGKCGRDVDSDGNVLAGPLAPLIVTLNNTPNCTKSTSLFIGMVLYYMVWYNIGLNFIAW